MGWIFLIGALLLIFLALLLEYLFASTSKKEELEDSFVSRTYAPKRRKITSFIILCIMIALFVVGTVILTDKTLSLEFWIAYILGVLLIIIFPILLYFIVCISDYEVITENGITIHRIFKTKFIKYDQMARYSYSYDQLKVYDKEGKAVLFVGDMRVGTKALIDALEHHGITREI